MLNLLGVTIEQEFCLKANIPVSTEMHDVLPVSLLCKCCYAFAVKLNSSDHKL